MLQDIFVPDLGQDAKVAIIEISVKVGDLLAADTTILTLESDKASMDLPMPVAGSIVEILVKKGDKVATGDKIGVIEVTEDGIKNIPALKSAIAVKDAVPERINVTRNNASAIAYAGPGARKFARELGVEINNITGTGRKQRIVKDDVKVHVQALLSGKRPATNSLDLDLPTMPKVDFSKYGAIETIELSKIKKLSGSYLHRNWLNIPHVTQFDVADLTELEDLRQSQKIIAEKHGVKMTPIVFIMKAVIAALQQFPSFNASSSVN